MLFNIAHSAPFSRKARKFYETRLPHLPDYADFRTFSVRVCAPTEFRVRVMMERLGRTDSDTVREEIERFDAARARILLASMSRRRTHGSTTSC